MSEPVGEFLLYETEDGRTRVECRFAAERRALLEAEGEDHNIKMLKAAAKALPSSNRRKKP